MFWTKREVVPEVTRPTDMPQPAIDRVVPAVIETATLALG